MSSQNEKSTEDLKILETKGVKILSCGLCLDFYNLKADLKVGEITNMYTISELLMNCDKVINIC